MSNTNRRSRGHLGSLIATAICVLGALLLLLNRQYVVDQLTVWQYKPNADVVSLADRTDMSNKGVFYFYASQPAVESAQEFNKKCDRRETSTAILGCYNGRNIYIYNVTDSKLDGIREVTAAHEMLHAAYARLGDDEKRQVNALLEAEYNKLKDDKQFAERMAFYARTEPGERDNELHSVIGTEVAAINPNLEEHYRQYFTDRSKVVALHAKYASVFSDLQSRNDALSAQLTELGDKIEKETLAFNTDVTQFNKDFDDFKARVNNGEFTTQQEIDAAQAALMARANQLDARRKVIIDEVSQYEMIRQELMSIASQSQALNRSIDSSLVPAPSL